MRAISAEHESQNSAELHKTAAVQYGLLSLRIIGCMHYGSVNGTH